MAQPPILSTKHDLVKSPTLPPVQVKTGILTGFLELDEKLRKIPEVANGEDKSGTTAVCALITEKHVLFSNCGDSRGVLSSGGANPVLCTQG